jgi:hypothetical protein
MNHYNPTNLKKAVIREINYVTVNGLVLTEGVHVLERTGTEVRISNSGV